MSRIASQNNSISIYAIRPLQEARFCSNLSLPSRQTGRKEFLTPLYLLVMRMLKILTTKKLDKRLSLSLFLSNSATVLQFESGLVLLFFASLFFEPRPVPTLRNKNTESFSLRSKLTPITSY